MTDISQVTAEFKLAKAMEALTALVDMVGKDHSIRKTERWRQGRVGKIIDMASRER